MNNFKIGMKVRRIKHSHYGMKIGDIGTISNISIGGGLVELKEYSSYHSTYNLKIVGSVNCPNIVLSDSC